MRRKPLFFFLALPVVALGALVMSPLAWAFGPGKHGGWHGAHSFHGKHHWGHADEGPVSPEDVRAHMAFGAERAYKVLGLSVDQQMEIDAVLDELAPDMARYKNDGREIRQDFHDALNSDDVDEQELEELRSAAIALADLASERGLRAMLDIREQLTPAQRDRLRTFMEMGPGRF